MKGYTVEAVVEAKVVKWMDTKDWATATGYAGIWGKRVDYPQDGTIKQVQPTLMRLINKDTGEVREKPGGENW